MVSAVEVFGEMDAGAVSVLVHGAIRDVTDVFLWGDGPGVPEGAIVAAVGVVGERDQHDVLRAAGDASAGAVVLRGPVGLEVRDRASASGLTLGLLAPEIGWADLVFLARALLRRPDPDADVAPHRELFALADAVATALSGAVTIEDAWHRVLAHASPAGLGDSTRTSTILGRAVSPEVLRRLRSTGALRRLITSDTAFVVPSVGEGFQQRVVMPVRLSSRVLGSIWVVHEGEMTTVMAEELATAAAEAARLMIRTMAREDIGWRVSTSVVRRALRDGDGTVEVLAGVGPEGAAVRVAMLDDPAGSSPEGRVVLWRGLMRRHGWTDPVLADVDGCVYAVVHDGPGLGGWDWLTHVSSSSAGAVSVAGSRAVTEPVDLVQLRCEAIAVRAAMPEVAVARYEDVWDAVVVARATAAVTTDDRAWLASLTSSRSERDDVLAETALAWLLHWGDVVRAARELGVHPNTVRQRLNKVRAAAPDIDLDVPASRLALALVLLSCDRVSA